MKRLLIWFLGVTSIYLFLFAAFGSASQETFTLNFDPSDLVFEKAQDYDRVRLPDCTFPAQPGTPLLPVRYVQIAIPADLEVVRVEVISFEYQELAGTYNIYPAQPFQPISKLLSDEKIEFVEPNPSVYELSTEYPGELAQVTNNGFLAGQHIAGVALYPLQCIPAEGKLILYTRIEFKLIFEPSSHSPLPVNRRSQKTADFYSDLAKSAVINPEDVRVETKGSLSQGEEVDYLIITDASFVPAFQQLADWKTLKGISTQIKEISWVLSNYPGYDDPEKVRNCIRDYYSNHGAKWVLLGGDTDILPYRLAPVMSEAIPCDLYFSDLDSNWDANGNHVYGESEDSVDMYPEVFVGRAPCNDNLQAQTFVNKCLTYETEPPADYLDRVLYAAEVLWESPFTDAAVLKDYIDDNLVPDHLQATKLYETSGNLNETTFRDGLNEGQNIVNHAGHANSDKLSIGADVWYSSDMDDLTNAPRYSLFYSFGCITAAIDTDCIAEHFVNNSNGGGFAYCGNTRLGWGMGGEPLQGPGPEFDIEFFRALFDSAAYQIGRTLGNSKIPFIPLAQESSDSGPFYRWTMFALLLLGDPSLELWTDTPAELSVSHAPSIIAGSSHFQVNVAEDSALVCCAKDGEILGRGYSAGGGDTVFFDSPLITFGHMHVTVTKHDYVAYLDSVPVIPPGGPYVIYDSRQINDSQGNNNGAVNPGETIVMPLTVKNIGLDPAYGVTATLREEDEYVSITDSVESFGDIDSGMTAESLGEYVFEVDAACQDSHVVRFDLEATDGESSWVTSFLEIVAEPDFVMSAVPETTVVSLGDSTSFKVVLTSLGGFNWMVDLNHTELPLGVTGFLDPGQLVPTDSSLLRLFTTLDASPQILPVTITATGGGITRVQQVVLAILAPPYSGPVWYVSTTGDDLVGNGSEEFPFGTVRKGMASAANGDTVLIERGRYVENIDFSGKSILVASRFIFDGLESTVDSTIIDGDGAASVVTFQSGEDSTSVVRGLTLTGGYNTYGGGVYCDGSSPSIVENTVVENACLWGRSGPGIFCTNGSRARIYRNVVARCTGPGAIGVRKNSYPVLINNTICGNSGGGISISNYAHPQLKNNILYNNAHYGIYLFWASCDVSYNDVYGHDADYAGDIADQTGINGNISADPFFEDALGGNYHLMANSPCIDAGDPVDPVPPGGGAIIDMGAFEYYKRPDFSMTVAPDSVRLLLQGDSASIKLVVISFMGFDATVDLSCSQLPSGVSALFDQDHLVPTDSSFLTLSTDSGASSGVYTIIITASGGDITHCKHVVLELASYLGPVWHVSISGDDSTGDGSSQFPFQTIQKGIDTATDGDTVLVERGQYVERIDFRGKPVLLASDFIFDGLESTIQSTVIDGDYLGTVVTFDSDEDSNSVIRGFTITRGYSFVGAGIHCSHSSPTIVENLLVRHICNPEASGGVAIACYQSQAKILRNLIAECAGRAAIGVRDYSAARVINNTVCSNSGGGISIVGGSDAYLKNNIFYGNADYGIHLSDGSCDVSYNDVFGHDEDYSGNITDQTGFNGNISADPLLADTSSGDYHLLPNSPCADAGDPADSVPPGGGDRIDMGAFEYPYEFVNGDANGDGSVTANDVVYLLNYLFRDGSPPYPMQAGDANHDGDVNAADIVYLIQYLYRGGPPPGEGDSDAQAILAKGEQPSTRIWLSSAKGLEAEETIEIFVRGSFDLDIAAVQLAIQYDPQSLSLNPALPSNLQALQVYFSQKDGLLKAGVLDLKGENWISAGRKVDILFIQIEGPNLSTLRIKEAVLAGRSGYVVPVKIVTQEEIQEHRPESFSLSQNYPNPFNPQTQIRYALPQNCDVKITVYNLLGRRVRVLVDEHQSAGYKTVHWDGKDEQGNDLASGIYFCKIRAGEFTDGKKMILIK